MYQTRKKRAAPKEHQISKVLRRQIVEGELQPGSQLPKRVELERVFSVSPVTLQRALQHLIEDGFIYAKAGHGTFVVDHPPHLTRYGLVFPTHPHEKEGWGNFYTALNNEALEYQRRRPGTLAIYYGLERPEHLQEREQLMHDVLAHRLAGLMFTFTPRNFRGTPILDEPRVARVAVMRAHEMGFPAIQLDGASMVDRTMEYLRSRGRSKVAIVASSSQPPHYVNSLMQGARQHGLSVEPFWVHAIHPSAPEWARNVVHLLTLLPAAQRPDSLFITDDNLVPHATAGLLAGGISVPGDMEVVAHANYPYLTPSVVPAKRIGYDARQVLATFLDVIDRQSRNLPVEETWMIPARMDEEVELAVV